MNIAAGKLDRRIEFEVATFSEDENGDEIVTWTLAFNRWAKIKQYIGREFEGAQQTIREATTHFTVRAGGDMDAVAPESHRIRYKGRIFEINSIRESEIRGDTLDLACSSRPDLRGSRAPESSSG